MKRSVHTEHHHMVAGLQACVTFHKHTHAISHQTCKGDFGWYVEIFNVF